MILKLLIFAVAAFLIYKWLGGTVSFPSKTAASEKTKKEESETMVECDRCGVYVATEETTIVNGKYVCNECVRKERK